MVGRKAIRGREHGLERTDNDLEVTSWPQVGMINQKNYYTEFLKRDDQILVYRLQNEENRNRMTRAARDRDRALAHSNQPGGSAVPYVEADADDTITAEDAVGGGDGAESFASKVVVIQPGSQYLRIGLASDVLPKTIPMVIARKDTSSESIKSRPDEPEEVYPEPKSKRRRVGETSEPPPMDENFQEQYLAMTIDLKGRLRRKGVRFVPNTREQAAAWNRKSVPDLIPEHNDSHHVEWTEVGPHSAQATYTGQAALRIPDKSQPRYKLHWPIRYGALNEKDYEDKGQLLRDFSQIIEDALKTLGLSEKQDRLQFGCVFVIPDLYEKNYVTMALELLFREFGFGRVSFIQESLSASFGAGTSTCCVVDIGAQKTSICCVDEGMCVENSRINLKQGGADVTEAFVKMLLASNFPYADLNLKRRCDMLMADELKQKCCTLSYADLSNGSQFFECYLRAFGQDTRFYRFKAYDEVMIAAMGYYRPELFDHTDKLRGKRKLIPRSYDLYDGSPNDPMSSAQAQLFAGLSNTSNNDDPMPTESVETPAMASNATPSRQEPPKPPEVVNGLEEMSRYAAGSPAQGDGETPQPVRAASPIEGERENVNSQTHPITEMLRSAELRDRTLATMPLDQAIALSIEHGARGDERKMRDFFGGIIPIGGGSQINGFNQFLEEELGTSQPRFRKEVIVAPPPREIDPQMLVWKGASVFGKLRGTNDSWISEMEYDRLGSRLLAYKCMWNW